MTENEETPKVLIASLVDCNLHEVAEKITKQKASVDISRWRDFDVGTLDFVISNKYYTADIELLISSNTVSDADAFRELPVEALIIFFDPSDQANVEKLKHVQSEMINCPEIQIALCKNCPESTRTDVIQWCISHSFELVELEFDEESSDGDINGYPRLKQALNSHTWSNMVLNSEVKSNISPNLLSTISELNTDSNETEYTDDGSFHADDGPSNPVSQGYSAIPQEGASVDALLDADLSDLVLDPNDEHDKFEKLFGNLSQMRETAARLAPEERKQYAEKITIEFWKALGGDEDEIQGLDKEESNS